MNISVIIPTKDRKLFLEKVLPSYLAELEVREVIIVVDGSTDGTIELVDKLKKSEPRIKLLDNEGNKGLPYSKNIGIKLAQYEYIFIGEDDVELSKGFFSTLSNHMLINKFDVICGRNIWRLEHETAAESIKRTSNLKGPYVNRKEISVITSLQLGSDNQEILLASPMLAKKEIFKQIGFDEQYKENFWREESDFQLSAQESGYRIGVCPHAICFNYIIDKDRGGVHRSIGFRRAIWIIINNWRFIRKHREFIENNFDIGAPLFYIFIFSIKKIYFEAVIPILIKPKYLISNLLRSVHIDHKSV